MSHYCNYAEKTKKQTNGGYDVLNKLRNVTFNKGLNNNPRINNVYNFTLCVTQFLFW